MRVSPGKSQLYGLVDGQGRGCVSGRERLTEADGGHLRAGVELELCSRHVCTSEACVFLGRLCTRSFVWLQNHGRNSSSHEIEQKKETHDCPRAARGRWVTRWLYYFPLLLHPPLPLHVLLMLCPPRVFVATLAREPLPQPPPEAGAERTCPSSPCRGGATATGCRRRELPSRNKSRGGAPAKSSHGELRPSLGPLLSAGGGSGLGPGDARNGPPAPLLRLRLLTCVMGDAARLAYVPARVKCL